MEVTTLKLRKCSVRLWRCDSIGRGSSTRAVPAAPHEPGAPAVPHAAHRLQDYKVFVVKIACDDEDSITTLGPSMDVQNSVNDMGILIKEVA
ncbi:hypothetical protein EVAR_57712_1 [Eumeta japonica]|uniref:Uncharacterized protein n=1 Tax=Eumeta variegata TaxID=151549 RepID=A0A4C1Y5Y6_EUMVA|nr:hypothetical protein EVAR_57712_1 [Eumeta japonica]